MSLKTGDKIPDVTFTVMTADGPAPMTTADLFAGKRIALFAVPGAYTPTCSASHVPSFLKNKDALKAKGIDAIACTSVNDVFVMGAWGKDQGVGDDIVMLADGNGDFASAIDLKLDASGFGMGSRSQRYSLVANDGVVEQINVEDGGEFKVSSGQYMLDNL